MDETVQDQDSTTPLGDVVAGPSQTPQENLVAQFTASLATLNLQDDQPAMHSMLNQLTSGLATMSLAQEQLSQAMDGQDDLPPDPVRCNRCGGPHFVKYCTVALH